MEWFCYIKWDFGKFNKFMFNLNNLLIRCQKQLVIKKIILHDWVNSFFLCQWFYKLFLWFYATLNIILSLPWTDWVEIEMKQCNNKWSVISNRPSGHYCPKKETIFQFVKDGRDYTLIYRVLCPMNVCRWQNVLTII